MIEAQRKKQNHAGAAVQMSEFQLERSHKSPISPQDPRNWVRFRPVHIPYYLRGMKGAMRSSANRRLLQLSVAWTEVSLVLMFTSGT